MRILITGSRDYAAWNTFNNALNEEVKGKTNLVIVHGACPTGADAMADEWVAYQRVQVERHPADWETHGKAAGPLRNQQMVDRGADLCIAFPQGASRGTRDCMRRAEAAGIRVVNYGDPS